MKTLFLGSYGFGNLGDELCLVEAFSRFGTEENWAFSFRPEFTRRHVHISNFIKLRQDIERVRPDRVVLGGGGVGFWPSIRDALHWMWDVRLYNPSAELIVHNIGVAKFDREDWNNDPVVKEVLKELSSFTVRDHVSRWLALEWQFGVDPKVTLYPETDLTPEELPFSLPIPGDLVGFSLTGQAAFKKAAWADRDRIRQKINALGSFRVMPIISTVQEDNSEEDDIAGFSWFYEVFLAPRPIEFRQMLDNTWWSENMTPLRLKSVIGNLNLLISQRKHNVIHAVGMNVPFIGVFPHQDDSIMRILFSLRHRIPFGSGVWALDDTISNHP
jgi:hypothetical protein